MKGTMNDSTKFPGYEPAPFKGGMDEVTKASEAADWDLANVTKNHPGTPVLIESVTVIPATPAEQAAPESTEPHIKAPTAAELMAQQPPQPLGPDHQMTA